EDGGVQFFAYDLKARKVLYSGPDGPPRYMMFAKSTGRVYYVPGSDGPAPLVRYDPEKGGPAVKIATTIALRSATHETSQAIIYTVSSGQGKKMPTIWSFNTKTEEAKELGPAPAASMGYTTSINADPTGRYLYYVPGAPGGSAADGSPIV